MLEREWDYYEAHRDEIVEKYCGKYAVITADRVVAAYDDKKAAYEETRRTLPLGTFMIHHITEEEEFACLSPAGNYA